MAKLSPRQRPRINNLRLQPSAVLSPIAVGCVVTPLTSIFVVPHLGRPRRTGCGKSSVAMTSNNHCGCSFSKRRSLQQASRPPKRRIVPSSKTVFLAGPGGPESGVSK